MNIPAGKTKVIITHSTPQNFIEVNDQGYIDGYVTAADNRPYAVFVRADGKIELVLMGTFRAINLTGE